MPQVNPEILLWARETAGLAPHQAIQRLGLRDARGVSALDRLAELESGETAPTRPQLLKMAKQYHRPLLTFYMTAPPRHGDRGQDFRTLPEGSSREEDALLDALARDVTARQSMVRAVLEDEAVLLPFVGSMEMADGVPAVVESIRKTLDVTSASFREQSSPEQAFALLRSKAELAGVFVLLIGNLGSYHTSIDVEVFRGFAISDNVAPFVIINDQDGRAAWSFTLLHELTHLWLGQTGVSASRSEMAVEQFCNDVASEFLLSEEGLAQFESIGPISVGAIECKVNDFATRTNLSNSMIVYKLYRIGRVEYDIWKQLSASFRNHWLQNRTERRHRARDQATSGPDYYVVRRHRVGSALIGLVHRAMVGGALSTSKAGKVLGVRATNVQKLLSVGDTTAGRAA